MELEVCNWKLCCRLVGSHCKLEVRSRKLEVGSRKLEVEVGSWELEVGRWMERRRELIIKKQKNGAGSSQLEVRKSNLSWKLKGLQDWSRPG